MIVRSWPDRLTDAGLGVALIATGLYVADLGLTRARAQSITAPGVIALEDESRRVELAGAYAAALIGQHQRAAAWLGAEWEAGRQPRGRLVVMSGDPATSGVVASDYDGTRLVTYLLVGNGNGLKGLGWDGHRLVGLALRQQSTAARVMHGRVVTRLSNESYPAPDDAPDGAPALVQRFAPPVARPPSRWLEWRSERVACPAGQIGEITERRRYLVERRGGVVVQLRQVATDETRVDPDAYRGSEPTSYEPERRGRCVPGSERQESRNVNYRQAPGEPPGVQCWDIERRTVTIRGDAAGRPEVINGAWLPAGSTCPAPTTPEVDPSSCDPQLSTPQLVGSEIERADTGCWGPEPGIPGGWSGTIKWVRHADTYELACQPATRYVNYRDCSGQPGCKTSGAGRGYYRSAYRCDAVATTTTACPPGYSGDGVTWGRSLVATLTPGGAPTVSDPPWVWSTTSCARVERETTSCPPITRRQFRGWAGGESGYEVYVDVVVDALSGEITRERSISVSGSGPAPDPGGANASGFAEHAGEWNTISDDCVYPSPPGGTSEGGSCFVAETLVRLADGRCIPIADVAVGDVVRGDHGPNRVRGLYQTKLFGRRLYALNGGRHFVTGEHPFRAVDGWCVVEPELLMAEDPKLAAELAPRTLRIGDVLVTEDGPITVTSIEGIHGPRDLPLFNLFLDGDHTFVADGYLVHNACGDSGHGTGEGAGAGEGDGSGDGSGGDGSGGDGGGGDGGGE